MKCNIFRNIQYKRSLTHGRTCRDQNQIGRLHTCSSVIQIYKSGCNTGNRTLVMGSNLDFMQCIRNNLPNRNKILSVSALHQIKNFFLSICQNIIQRFFANITCISNFFIGLNQPPQSCFFCNNICIIFDICRCWYSIQYILDKFKAADLRRYILFFQAILQCDHIDRLCLIVKLNHSIKYDPVLSAVKIISLQNLRSDYDRFFIHQHGTNNRLLSFYTVRKYPL